MELSPVTTKPTDSEASQRALRVLAKSVFKELKRNGYERAEMVSFASELLELVTDELRDSNAGAV